MERSAESEQTERWIAAKRGFLFPVRAFSKVFRGKYLDALSQAFERGGASLCRARKGKKLTNRRI